jgi:hypothetical protein
MVGKARSIAGAAALSLSLVAVPANAGDEGPCGNFDFSGGLSCKIEVSGGCKASCTPFKFEVGCTGVCTAKPQPACVDTCGEACIKECDPALLDCFEGCHNECDAPVMEECKSKGGTDCSNTAKAQCDIHCKDSCKVPPSDCQEHCESCCTGGCTTQVNYDCNYDCFADLQGGCEAQCEAPSGAIFCNGQYVNASDITACVTYLLEKGLTVDASASLSCDLSGCKGDAGIGLGGCSTSSADPIGTGLGLAGFGATVVGLAVASVRRRRKPH